MASGAASRWPAPTSRNQQMVARLAAQGYVANVPFLLRASGPLDRDILGEALNEVTARHEVLRSPFAFADTALVQCAPQPVLAEIAFRDLSGRRAGIRTAHRACAARCRAPFPIAEPARFSATVFRLSDDDHVIALIVDHLAADGMSLAVLGQEWRSVYQAIESRLPPQAMSPAPQYRDFAARQRQWLRGPEAASVRAWWADRLAGYAGKPAEGIKPAISLDFSMSYEVGGRIARLCTRHRATPFMVVLAAYAIVLFALDGSSDLVVATVRANRRDPGTAGMVGNLANLIPIRIDPEPDGTVGAFLDFVAATCRASYARDTMPFLEICAVAGLRLGLAASALTRFAINFVPFPAEPDIWTPTLRVSQEWGLLEPRPLATGAVSLFVRQRGMRFGGTLIVDPAAVPQAWPFAFAARLGAAIVDLADRPDLQLADLVALVAHS